MTTSHVFPHHGAQHERWLLAAAQRNDRHAVEELICRYEPLVRAASAAAAGSNGRERDDLAQVARSALWRAIRSWQTERGPFPAYAKTCVRNSVINEIHAASFKCRQILSTAHSIDTPVGQSCQNGRPPGREPAGRHLGGEHVDLFADPVAIVLLRERLAAIRVRLSRFTARERRLLAGTLNGKTQQQLADEEHTSWRAINCAVTRLRAKLTDDSAVV